MRNIFEMIKIANVANTCENLGFLQESDSLNNILVKLAQTTDDNVTTEDNMPESGNATEVSSPEEDTKTNTENLQTDSTIPAVDNAEIEGQKDLDNKIKEFYALFNQVLPQNMEEIFKDKAKMDQILTKDKLTKLKELGNNILQNRFLDSESKKILEDSLPLIDSLMI